MLAKRELAAYLKPGLHASTFGGNPIAAAAGIAYLQTVEAEGLLARAQQIGDRFSTGLESIKGEVDFIRQIRVAGTMIGVELEMEGAGIVQAALDHGLLINCTQGNVLRFLPALTLTDEEVDQSLEILSRVLVASGDALSSPSA
jgi:acetylornithine/succinyldiaminopimelate/putrescine aminotransferase